MTTCFDRLVILDFEATCKPGPPPDPQEIIEFPSVLLDLREGRIVDEFTSFVRPVHHPTLSDFCTELTSITEEELADAPTFVQVLDLHTKWLLGHNLLGPERPGIIVTCGDWDLGKMLPAQCHTSGVPIDSLPSIYRRWINIKKTFGASLCTTKVFGMPSMLRNLGLELLGHHHRGIDDCRNIARIAQSLGAIGAEFSTNGHLTTSRYPPLHLTLRRGDAQHPVILNKRRLAPLLVLASRTFRLPIATLKGAGGAFLTDSYLTELVQESELECLTEHDLSGLLAQTIGDAD